LIRKRNKKLESFVATDAATFRIASSYFAEDYDMKFFHGAIKDREDLGEKVNGYYPSYVQIYNTAKVEQFYPWEMCFGVRNPSTNIYSNGYGTSELEELINVVTSMLWGDEYNRRFFSQGSAPKGLLRIKGNVNETALQQFKQQWQSMITGVMQSWKTPVVEADVDWIDLQKNNRDMEYTSWMEYLIKLACAIYAIDPIEIGWDISRGNAHGGLNEGSKRERLMHSKDKGLYPLLKFIQRKINRYIVEQINPDFELVFMGLNGMTIEEELKLDIDKLSNFVTLNEVREKYELKPLDGGDMPNNSVFVGARNQAASMAAMGGEGEGMEGEGEEGEEENPFSAALQGGEGEEEEQNPFDEFGAEEDIEEDTEEEEKSIIADTLTKAFDNFIKQEYEK
jgi:hypothetical protein